MNENRFQNIETPKIGTKLPVTLTTDEIDKIISCIDNTIENIVTEIKKSEIVYTQSYHGAYWSALCGKKTIIYTPWSTKFLNCDFPVKVMARGEFLEVNYNEDIPEPDLNYLNECRTRNLKLYENISGICSVSK